jgi:hypothetical protein
VTKESIDQQGEVRFVAEKRSLSGFMYKSIPGCSLLALGEKRRMVRRTSPQIHDHTCHKQVDRPHVRLRLARWTSQASFEDILAGF